MKCSRDGCVNQLRQPRLGRRRRYCSGNCKNIANGRVRKRKPRNLEAGRQYNRAYYQRNREEILVKNRARKRAYRRGDWLSKAYGITEHHYLMLLSVQDGACAICGTGTCATGRHLAVDHDHVSGSLRGLLCAKCNVGLSFFEQFSAKAAAYLSAPVAARAGLAVVVPVTKRRKKVLDTSRSARLAS